MPNLAKIQKIEITTLTVVKTAAFLVGMFVIWQLRAVAFMLFFAFILYSAFDPVVDFFEKKKVPRWVTIVLIYLIGFALLTFILVVSANALIDQVGNLSKDSDSIIKSFIEALTKVFPWLENKIDPSKLAKDITGNGLSNKYFLLIL
jgi:predicted PurR-regulated permease PerM